MKPQRYNAWKHAILSPQQVVGNENIKPHVEALIRKVANLLGLTTAGCTEVIKSTFEAASTVSDSIEFEKLLKRKLVAGCDRTQMLAAIRDRSVTIFDEIKDYFVGQSMLDVGCGNGFISEMSKPYFKDIQLLDVVNYVGSNVSLPFLPYTEGQKLPVKKLYDTVLLLTVLHHSNDPIGLLEESWRAAAKRVIIIESVFGVHAQPPAGKYALAGLQERDQIAFAVFVDWLYNRVLEDNIPVPYNFTTPDRWIETFSARGMHLVEMKNLGQDIKVAPELHFLFVLEKPV